MSESFLSIMGLLRDMPVGNPSQTVSCPSWDHCVTIPQETFANSFLSVMGPLRNNPTGNLRQQFPVRHGTTVHHTPTGNHPAASAARELP